MLVETDGETVFSSRGALAQEWKTPCRARFATRFTAIRGTISNGAQRLSRVTGKPARHCGQDEFVRVSWDEALDLIHQNINAFVRLMVRHRFLLVPTAAFKRRAA